MILLKEIAPEVRSVITEGASPAARKYFIEGIFAQANVTNRNKRVYPAPIMTKEVGRYIKEAVDAHRAYGELGHPDNPGVNMPLVSHIIESLQFDANNVIGKAKIIDTPHGKIVKAILDEGGSFGVSTRGLGSVHKQHDGTMVVQEDFTLTAIDIVADPSAPDAYVTGLVENRQWVWENGVILEKDVSALKKEVLAAPARKLNEEFFLKVFNKHVRKLAGKSRTS